MPSIQTWQALGQLGLSIVAPLAALTAVLDFAGLPLLAAVALTLLASPGLFLAAKAYRRSSNRRRAAALGAELPPTVHDESLFKTGATNTMLKNMSSGRLGAHLFSWKEQYGPTYMLETTLTDRIATSEPDYIKSILATGFNSFEKGPITRIQNGDILGSGVFNADGDVWKFHRGITRPFFSRDRISDFDVFERHSRKALDVMAARLATGHTVDFQDLVSRFTIDSATEFLFGKDVHSLDCSLPYAGQPDQGPTNANDEFAHAFLGAQMALARRARYGTLWPLFELFDSEHSKNRRILRNYVDPIVRAAVTQARDDAAERGETVGEKGANTHEVHEGETMLAHMVRSTQDPTLLRDETLNILIAGRDTTASLLTSTIYELARHPEVLAKLREEILETVGTQTNGTLDPADLRGMRYLRAVLNEVLRLWPPVPFNGRASREDVLWPAQEPGGKPIFVPAGTLCTYSVFVLHRRKDLWGEDAEEFDPMRFLDERVKLMTGKGSFIFVPFNAGPRICLGQQFAYNEAGYFLVRLLQRFASVDLKQPVEARPPWTQDKEDEVWMRSHLTLFAHGGVWVNMK
ncbi:cytochrome P450 [Peniophora sp. CONT]|nr:cytochrome P450 [Peniophora sp. CONT]